MQIVLTSYKYLTLFSVGNLLCVQAISLCVTFFSSLNSDLNPPKNQVHRRNKELGIIFFHRFYTR